MQHRPTSILSASINLLGICFIIITGLKLANANLRSYADEVTWLAAFLLFVAALHAYFAIRNGRTETWQEQVADYAFLGGMTVLALAVIIAATAL